MLADIELAQTLQAAPGEEEKVEEVPHPLDRDYQLLRCQLQLLDSGESEYKVTAAHLPLRYPESPGLPHCPLRALTQGELGRPQGTRVRPQASVFGHGPLFSTGNTDLPETDWQQLPMPSPAARLESEPGRGGEGDSAPIYYPVP